jgi:hypothetical protein
MAVSRGSFAPGTGNHPHRYGIYEEVHYKEPTLPAPAGTVPVRVRNNVRRITALDRS